MGKGKKAVKGAAAKDKKAAKQDAKAVPHQEVSAIEQVPSTADAEQHQTATHQAVVGLSNLGNTCFFNSSVQMLLACAPLQQMLLQKDHDITRGPLGFALQQATLHAAGRSSMSKGGSNSTYNPQSLLSAVCCHAPVFKGKQQHDAHELTRMLLDGLQTQEQRYKDLSRRGPSKSLAGLPNGAAALANGHHSKQGGADLSTTSSSSDDSTSSSSDSSDSSLSPVGRPTANGYVAQAEDGSVSAVSTAMGNGTANGTGSGLNSSSDDSSSTSAGSNSSTREADADADAEDTAASAGEGLDDLCKAYLRKPKSPGPTLDSLADEANDTSSVTNVTEATDVSDTAASGPGTADDAAANEADGAAANGGEAGGASSSSSSDAGASQLPAAADAASADQLTAQAADSAAANGQLPPAAKDTSGSGAAACTVCGCSIPLQQQQQGTGSNPLQRKSLLPPAPPTSAGSSSVEAVFGGVLSSYVTCTACGYCSISYEPFLDLSLPIPLGNGPEEGLIRKASLLSRLANTARGKKKAVPKDAAADSSVDGSSTAGAPDAAAATAAAEAAAETAAAAAAAVAAAQRKKNLPHKEKRRLQQVAKEAAKEANKLARLAKKKQQEQEDAAGSSRGDGQQQGPAAATDPALFEDIPPTNYYTREQVELMETVRALNDSQQQQQQQSPKQGQPQQVDGQGVQQCEQEGDADAAQPQQRQEQSGGAAVSAGADGSPRVSLSRVTAASDEGASTVSGWTDLGGANASPPTSAVSCWGGTWGDVQPSRSPVPPGSTSSSHVPPPSSSSGFAPSSSDAGAVPAGGSDGSGTSPTGAPGQQQQQAQPGRKTLHRRFASLSNLSTLTSGAKGGLSSLFTGRHSRQGSKDKDALDKLAAAATNGSTNGATQGAQRSQCTGVTSPSSVRGAGLKGLFLNRAATPPPPRPSSALGVVSELGEGQGSGGLAPRNSIPEDGPVVGPVDPVDHGLTQQQQQQQLLGADGVFTPLGVMPGVFSVSSAGPEGATAEPSMLQQDGSSTAGNGTQPSTAAAAAPAGSGGFLPAVQLATRRLQRAFSDDAVIRLGSMHRSSSSSSGGGSAGGDGQSPAAAGVTAVNGPSAMTSAAANGSSTEGEPAGSGLALAGTYSNPFAAPAVQQQQHLQQAQEAADTRSLQQQDGPSSTSPAPAAVTDPAAAAAAAVVPGQDPFAAAAVVDKGDSLAVKHCMATFFLREDVSWECPKEKAAWKERRLSAASGRLSADGGSGAGASAGAAAAGGSGGGVCAACSQRQQQGGGGVAIAAAHPRLQQLLERAEEDEEGPIFKQVSFSERQPQVHFVPGSVEQRGTDLSAALAGRRPFCRALTWGGASLLLTAQLGETFLEGAVAGQQLLLGLKAAGEGGVANAPAARVLPGGREVHLGALKLPDVQDLHLSGDESSALLQHWAQLVLNCMADLVHCEGGITGLQAMVAGGLTLLPGDGARHALRPGYVDASSLEGLWKVRGQLPQPAAAAAAAADSADVGVKGDGSEAEQDSQQQQQQQQQQGYWEYPAGDAAEDAAADAPEGPTAAAGIADALGDNGAANTSDLHSHGSCMSPAGSSAAAASGGSPVAVSDTSRQASGAGTPSSPAAANAVHTGSAAAAVDGGGDMFAMDEDEGQCDPGSEQQEQGAHELSTQGWQGDALSSASSGTLGHAGSGTKVLRSGSSLGSRDDGEGGSSSTSRSASLFRKVPVSPAGAATAASAAASASRGNPNADDAAGAGSGSSGAVTIGQSAPAAAAVSQPVNIKPLQGSPPPGVSLSPAVGSSGGGRTPLGHSGSLRRSSLRRRSSSCCRTAHKSYRIYLPPQVLLLHLKRFQHDGRGRLNKLDTAVKFEFELDLSPFMAENAPSSSGSSGSTAPGSAVAEGNGGVDGSSCNGVQAQPSQQQQQQLLMYDLVGLVVHMGTMRGGHYIAYVKRVHGLEAHGQSEAGTSAGGSSSSGGKGRVQWYYVSDTSVRAVNVSEVAAAQAYMLLYVRRPARTSSRSNSSSSSSGRMNQ